MEFDQSKLKQYFLEQLPPQEVEEIELLIISDAQFCKELEASETELLEDYLENSLTAEETKRFESNYLITEERNKKLQFLKSLKQFAQKKEQNLIIQNEPPSFFESIKNLFIPRKFVFGLGSLALVLTIGISGYFVWQHYNSPSEVLVALNKYQKTERPVESRISGFNYAPKSEGTRGKAQGKNDDLDYAELSARSLIRQNGSAENIHELGRVYLTQQKFDLAIEELEKAIKENPNIADIHNDLGVAFMEKGKLNKEEKEKDEKLNKVNNEAKPYLELFAKANKEFAKSIDLKKDALEPRFNQALCISLLNDVLPNQTKEAWENYLKFDSDSQWADEARERLKKLEFNKPVGKTKEEILQEFLLAKEKNDTEKAWQVLSTNRETLTGKLIPQQLAFMFIDKKIKGEKEKAGETLNALVYSAKLEEQKSGDFFWRDLTNYYVNITDDKISKLKEAQENYFEAFKLEGVGKLDEAIEKFNSSKDIFSNASNIWMEQLCNYWIASLKFRLSKLDESEMMFDSAVAFANQANYKWLATHSFVRLSFIKISKNNYSDSLHYCDLALKLAKQTNDLYNLVRIYYSFSYNYKCLKRFDLSLKFSEKNFELIKKTGSDLMQLWDTFDSTAGALYESEFYETASIFQKEALHFSEVSNDKFAEHLSKVYLGIIYTKANKIDEARTFFNESRQIAEAFGDQQTREKGLALINLKEGNLEKLNGNYQKAIDLFRKATVFYSSSEYHLDEYESRKGELLAYLAVKDNNKIQESIPLVTEIFRKYRTEILEEQNRNSFFDKEQNIYDLVVDYELENGNVETAFNYFEESKARSLLDLQSKKAILKENEVKFSKETSEPLKINQIRPQIPENTQLVEYTILEDKLLVWIISKTDFEVKKVNISTDKLKDKINNYLDILNKHEEDEKNLSKELFNLLIEPISTNLNPEKQICFIPDKFLFHLPFASLISPQTGEPLVMKYDLLISPSANVFLTSSRKAKEMEQNSGENLLVIGNPLFNGENYSENKLAKLPSAEKEALKIAENYSSPKVLIGNEVEKKTFINALSNSEIIHFAGHYIVNENSPMQSKFVLKGNETLENRELFEINLDKAKLIVLSACQTGVESYYQGEGMMGASRFFLANGIPLVVASQWNVDSELATKIMIQFHYYRKKENLSTIQALRKAQIDLIQNEDPKFKKPFYWATFQVFGGAAEF
ncbi:MAG: CHAT domain-containing protein [Pyrinomonadaceae bacterium]|nr:CHAT domain-containing protein [Pyrinomonadaceae bacterium]